MKWWIDLILTLIPILAVIVIVALIVWLKIVAPARQRARAQQQQATPDAGGVAAPVTAGWLSRHWLKVIFLPLLILLLLDLRSCVFGVPDRIERTSEKIAQGGREFEHAISEAARKLTSAPDDLTKDEPDEDSGLSWIDPDLVRDWHLAEANRADLEKSGWHVSRRRVDCNSAGSRDYEGPILNNDFMEEYVLRIVPGDNWSKILQVLGPSVSLENGSGHQVMSFRSHRSEYTTKVTRSDMGLVYLRATSSLSGTPRPFGFTIDLKKPKVEPSTVRFAYWRKFDRLDTSDWGRLPLQLPDVEGKPTRIGFDVRIRLSRLPKAGETTMETPLPDLDDLMNVPVLVKLIDDDGTKDGTIIKEWEMHDPLLEIVSEQVRDYVRIRKGNADACQSLRLQIWSGWLLRVDVAVRFRKSLYKKGEW